MFGSLYCQCWQTWTALYITFLLFIVIPVTLVVFRIRVWTFGGNTFPLSVRNSTSTFLITDRPMFPFTPVWFFCYECELLISNYVQESVANLDNIVHCISFLHNHFHNICCILDQNMDIWREYISFFCKKFHLHTSCYTQTIPPIHPSMVFLLKPKVAT